MSGKSFVAKWPMATSNKAFILVPIRATGNLRFKWRGVFAKPRNKYEQWQKKPDYLRYLTYFPITSRFYRDI